MASFLVLPVARSRAQQAHVTYKMTLTPQDYMQDSSSLPGGSQGMDRRLGSRSWATCISVISGWWLNMKTLTFSFFGPLPTF